MSHLVNANKKVSDTPISDSTPHNVGELGMLCRKLERELNAAKERIKRMESFINRFLDPEDLGYAVNNYVRDDAREALGRERVESGDGKEKL